MTVTSKSSMNINAEIFSLTTLIMEDDSVADSNPLKIKFPAFENKVRPT